MALRPCTGDKLEAAKKACAVLKKEETEALWAFSGWQLHTFAVAKADLKEFKV